MAASAHEVAVGLQRILVATDLSPASASPVRFALDLARAYHAKCYVFHSVGCMGYTLGGAEVEALATEAADRDIHDLERELQESGDLKDVAYKMMVRKGDIRQEIEAVIRDEHIDLIVLGTHARTGVGRLLRGSIAEQIFRAVRCPVLTIGPCARCDHPPRIRRILFPTDLTAESRQIFAQAVEVANRNDSQLVLLHTVMPFPVSDPGNAWYPGSDLSKSCQTVHDSVLAKMKQLAASAGKLAHTPEFVVEFQYPAEAICEAADAYRADLVIMGVKHASAFRAGHMPWATAHEVVCRAGCPVLTLRH